MKKEKVGSPKKLGKQLTAVDQKFSQKFVQPAIMSLQNQASAISKKT